jgi:nitrate/nitrite transport system ATP-binding protein
MSNGPVARVAEIVRNTMPRDRQRATLHHDPQYYRIRNHLVDFLVTRSKDLSNGRAPIYPPVVEPGLVADDAATTAIQPAVTDATATPLHLIA